MPETKIQLTGAELALLEKLSARYARMDKQARLNLQNQVLDRLLERREEDAGKSLDKIYRDGLLSSYNTAWKKSYQWKCKKYRKDPDKDEKVPGRFTENLSLDRKIKIDDDSGTFHELHGDIDDKLRAIMHKYDKLIVKEYGFNIWNIFFSHPDLYRKPVPHNAHRNIKPVVILERKITPVDIFNIAWGLYAKYSYKNGYGVIVHDDSSKNYIDSRIWEPPGFMAYLNASHTRYINSIGFFEKKRKKYKIF